MYDFNSYPYPSKRFVKYSVRGMCATSHSLAAQAGVDILKAGGNAFDAAIAAATCLTVLEPQSNAVGSDAFAIIWSGGKIHGLNSSGFSGKSFSAEAVRKSGHNEMPRFGFTPVTVPGAPAAWAAINERFGRLSLERVMAPAINYAAEGQAVSAGLASAIARFAGALKSSTGGEGEFAHWFENYMQGGSAPVAGQVMRFPRLAHTLELIAKSGAQELYKGELADKIDAFSQKHGGYIRRCDLEEYTPEWNEPVKMNYRGYDVWELPPNGQGIVALMALNILKGFEPARRDDIVSVHRQLEAIKLAFADGHKYITDPKSMSVSVRDLLSDAYGDERRRMISDRAILPSPGVPRSSGTVYLCASDNEGNMISFIQSNYMGFGSGLVVPETGISLQNRGHCFSLTDGHDNIAAPRKRPYHTIIPGFLSRNGEPVGPFGVMGGFMQPQGHTQVMLNYIDGGMNPQACLDAPRWQWMRDKTVVLEPGYPQYVIEGLKARGHNISYDDNRTSFGHGQIIFKTEQGTLMGATEPRCEGECAAW